MAVADAVDRLAGTELRVAFCGFAPGFAYLTGLPAEWAVPRLASPRPKVPAGSVALAGEYAGIYPTASPGGWRLVGRTDAVPLRRRPRPARPARARAPAVRLGARMIEVAPGRPADHRAGPRPARLRPPRRPPVRRARRARAARWPTGSSATPTAAAGLEITLAGVRAAAAARPATVAVTGAPRAGHGGRPRRPRTASPVPVPAGARGRGRAGRVHGVRSYLAVAGGIAVAAGARQPVDRHALRARARRRCATATCLPVGRAVRRAVHRGLRAVAAARRPTLAAAGAARAAATTGSPRTAGEALLGTPYTVSPVSNRVGARLAGAALTRADAGELPSEGVVLGAVQVPADGQPLIFLADHPTTGGYPVIGVVDDDLARSRRPRPGLP